jgi:hypothetical protein
MYVLRLLPDGTLEDEVSNDEYKEKFGYDSSVPYAFQKYLS